MDALTDEIRIKIIHPMSHAELFRAYGKSVGGGILLYGPPGCGKTHLARATAGEVKAAFLAVGIGVLFFDEVDALAASPRALVRQDDRTNSPPPH